MCVELIIILLALGLLMFTAYRGFSVILFAPICALFAVLLTDPSHVLPFSHQFLWRRWRVLLSCISQCFCSVPFLERSLKWPDLRHRSRKRLSGLSGQKSDTCHCADGRCLDVQRRQPVCCRICRISFCEKHVQEANIPKRLIPGTIALGAFTFTMDALPGTPQIKMSFRRRFSKQTFMPPLGWV